MSNFFTLTDKVAIITGGGRGIGAATALRLAKAGASIVISDIQSESAEPLAETIRNQGGKCLVLVGDVSQMSQAQKIVADTVKEYGKVDILVNNAGITRDAMLHKLSEEQWDEVIRVNLKGPFAMGQAAAQTMIKQKSGRIINISSVAWKGNIGQTNYSASKAGVVGMTRTWAIELARHGITVNAIAPGLVESVLTQKIPAEIRDGFIQRIPLKRIGQPEDIAQLVHFLASDEAAYVTGQTIQADGGLSTGISMS